MPAPQECQCENSLQSVHSPGLFEDREVIAYILFQPDQWDEHTGLTNAALAMSKLKKRDLSVCRVDFTDLSTIQKMVVQPYMEKKPHRRVVGALSCCCISIRGIKTSQERRLFCVIDDGKRGFAGHALLGFSNHSPDPTFWQRNSRQAARLELVDLFNQNSRAELGGLFN